MINQFKNEYEMFSNFYPVTVYFEGRAYPSVEHAFVAAKSYDPFFRAKLSRLSRHKAWKAKEMGQEVKLRSNWNIIRVPIMRDLQIQKYNYKKFREKLLSTGEEEIVEGNYWHDNYWGDCYCKKCKNIPGENMLGKLIMEARERYESINNG